MSIRYNIVVISYYLLEYGVDDGRVELDDWEAQ